MVLSGVSSVLLVFTEKLEISLIVMGNTCFVRISSFKDGPGGISYRDGVIMP